MKQSKALADTYILLAGSSITRTTRPGEEFSRVEPEGQIKPLKWEQRHIPKRLIFMLVLVILLLSRVLTVADQTEQFQIGYGEVISDGMPAPGAAYIEVYSPLSGWFYFDVEFRADGTDNSAAFAQHKRPSQRSLTQAQVTQQGSRQWSVRSWYRFAEITPVIQEVINRGGWQSGNSLSLIARGTGQRWGSVIFAGYDLHPTLAPRLVVRYRQN